jgi:hypothetical protein
MRQPSLRQSVDLVSTFLARRPLAESIAGLEANVEHATGLEVQAASMASGVDPALLAAAVTVRREFGRIGELIHAAAILVLLPTLLEEGETLVNRPALASENDARRPFDVETNRRVAEFKLGRWAGGDAQRKREVFRDFVRLAADTSGRRPEIYLLGPEPARFLATSRQRVSWALERSPVTLRLFHERFGDVDVSVASFAAGPGARVRVVDAAPLLPPGVLDETEAEA